MKEFPRFAMLLFRTHRRDTALPIRRHDGKLAGISFEATRSQLKRELEVRGACTGRRHSEHALVDVPT